MCLLDSKITIQKVSMNKVLSIIIPTYNAEAFIKKGLDSIVSITENLLNKIEVIVVNDGSLDNSVAIAKKYVDKYPQIFKIINKQNGGHGSAINEGMKIVSAKYLKVLDADDWVDVDELEKTLLELEEENADVVITGFTTYHIIDKEYKRYRLEVDNYKKLYTVSEIMDVWKKIQWGITLHGIIYRSEFYQKLNYKLTEKVFYEDEEFVTVPVCYAETIRCLDTYMYIYRIGDVNQSVSEENLIKRLPDVKKVIWSMLEAGENRAKFSSGGERYWVKKTTMVINNYYETALLRKGGRAGWKDSIELESMIRKKNEMIYKINKKKSLVFKLLGILGIKDKTYRKCLEIIKRF